MRFSIKLALWFTAFLGLSGCNSDVLGSALSESSSVVMQAAGNSATGVNTEAASDSQLYVINGLPITESSGLARSNLNRDLFWTHNDSGGNVAIYALTKQGSHVATYHIQGLGVTNLDWEDMTSAVLDGKSWLFIADVGDNNAFRPFTTVYMVPEPEFDMPRFGIRSDVVNVHRIFNLVFPNGQARDVEAIGLDSETQMAYLISKREVQPRLFSFPVKDAFSQVSQLGEEAIPALPEMQVLVDHGPINIPRAPAGYSGNADSFNWVTSMDISDDGKSAYVGTLLNGYIYTLGERESWPEAFKKPPREFALPPFSQIEAGAFDHTSRSVYVTSENYPARMARIAIR